MAAEAVLKIKEAEEQAKETVRAAGESARQILAQAAQDGQERRKAILAEAGKVREKKFAAAQSAADTACRELAAAGNREKQAILAPGEERLEQAVNLIVERIVNG